MKPAVECSRRTLSLGLLCGILVAGVGCPRSLGDPLDRVRDLHAQNRYEPSLEILRALMDEDPTDPEVNYLFAKTLVEVGELSLAIWPLQRAVEFPEHAFDASMLLARATLDSRMPEDAIAAADVALAIEPDNVEALALRAHARLKAGRHAGALADVERAVQLDPGNISILVPRVLVLLEFGQADQAEAALDESRRAAEASEIQPSEETQARLCLANAAFALDDDDAKSAEVIYLDCLDAYPTDPRVVLRGVGFYDAIGEPERASALLRRTFEETRATEFGYALSRRTRRLRDEQHPAPPAAALREVHSDGRI